MRSTQNFHADADANVAKGVAAMEGCDETPQAEAAECNISAETLIASPAAKAALESLSSFSPAQIARIEAGLAAEREGRILSQGAVEARLATRRQQ